MPKLWLIVTQMFFLSIAFAHGEDRPGPHGGSVRMPGAFHTELVRGNDETFKVYLLDMAWEHPVVKNSSVSATIKYDSHEVKIVCQPQSEHFLCSLPKNQTLKKSQAILLNSKRSGIAAGGVAQYEN